MGREIRRVPANWQHPKSTRFGQKESFQPLYNSPYESAISEWIQEHFLWMRGEHPDQQGDDPAKYQFYAQWNGNPPAIDYYRPAWKPEEMTWYQVYETVSEGTPVTPPFETQAELVEYLVENGDYWDQKRRERGSGTMPCDPWTRKQAESFVYGHGYAPSLVISNGKVQSGVEFMAEQGQ